MHTKDALIRDIRKMGITSEDTVLIHTSMRAIGKVEGGADTVIDAFRAVLTDGLFLVPTHTWATVTPAQPVYHAKSTVPCIGALPCAAVQREDGVRSLHPTHSMKGWGRNAAAFLSGEERACSPAPPGFAWARLADVSAKILLIGVGHNRNTFIHAVDEMYDLPDRLSTKPFDVTVLDRDGAEYKHPYRHHACSRTDDVSRYFVNFEAAFEACGVQTHGVLGAADVRIVDAAACRDTVLRIYRRAAEDAARTDKELCDRYLEIPVSYYK